MLFNMCVTFLKCFIVPPQDRGGKIKAAYEGPFRKVTKSLHLFSAVF